MSLLYVILSAFVVYVSIMLVGAISDGRFMDWINFFQKKLGMSDAVAGETIQATGTSAPEIMTNFVVLYLFPIVGAATISPTVGLFTIIGSAIFQITVVIGFPMLYSKESVQLESLPVIRSCIVYAGSVFLLLSFAYTGFSFSWLELVILASYHIAYTAYIVRNDTSEEHDTDEEEDENDNIYQRISNQLPHPNRSKIGGFFVILFAIAILCYVMVFFTEVVGTYIGLSMAFMAVTVLAAGSSAPEIFSNIYLVKRGKTQQAISNAVGSNTMDICMSFSFVAIPYAAFYGILPIEPEVVTSMIVSSGFLFAYLVIFLGMLWYSKWKITRSHAWLLIAMFGFFMLSVFIVDKA